MVKWQISKETDMQKDLDNQTNNYTDRMTERKGSLQYDTKIILWCKKTTLKVKSKNVKDV